MEEERRRREEIEAMLKEQRLMWMQERERMMEAERQRAEAERQSYDAMFAYVQGIGSAVNYQPPRTVAWPPPPPPPMAFVPSPVYAVTPVSMNVIPCIRLN